MSRLIAVLGILVSLLGLAVGERIAPSIVVPALVISVTVAFLVILVVEIIKARSRRRFVLKNEDEYIKFMKKYLTHPGKIVMVSHNLSISKSMTLREILKDRAQKEELTLFTRKKGEFSSELLELGASVTFYEDLDFEPRSRFTIVSADRDEAKVAVDWQSPKPLDDGRDITRRVAIFRKGEHPYFSAVADLVTVLEKSSAK